MILTQSLVLGSSLDLGCLDLGDKVVHREGESGWGRAVMQVVTLSPAFTSFNLHSCSHFATWNGRPPKYLTIFQSSRHRVLSKRSFWKQKSLELHVECKVATSSDAGSGSEKTSQIALGNSQAVELYKKGIMHLSIREAHPVDYWEVADTHCGAFLPDQGFPIDMMMRLDRVLAMLGSFSVPSGRKKKCFVAVESQLSEGVRSTGVPTGDLFSVPWKGFTCLENASEKDALVERVLGILTVDTVAEFLPRRKPMGLRRTGIAYISNVAVRQRMRRMGIAKRLVQAAEVVAASWGCRSIALHCDINNPAAAALYLSAGYKLVKTPAGAKWPQPKTKPGSEFCLMMKCLSVK